MLRILNDLDQYEVMVLDGPLGRIIDFLFDVDDGKVRYFVVATGRALEGREIAVSVLGLGEISWDERQFFMPITLERIRQGPLVDSASSLTRRCGNVQFQHLDCFPEGERAGLSSHGLNSARALQGYRVCSSDETLGHIEDFIVEEGSWIIRYWILRTDSHLRERVTLLAPEWSTGIDWDKQRANVPFRRDRVECSPSWHRDAPIEREFEAQLFAHYGRTEYWVREERPTLLPPSRKSERSILHSVKPPERMRPLSLLTSDRDRTS